MLAINPARYIQHNPAAEDGVEGFRNIISQVPKDSVRVNTVRVFQNGAFVVAGKPTSFYDLFRVHDGKVPSIGKPSK